MSPPCALILGHSFVPRLRSFLSLSNIYCHDLGPPNVAEIALFGVGGRTVAEVEKFDLSFVRAWKPDIVIFKLGTNDLTTFSPESVGSSFEELAQLLNENCGIKVIRACQVIKRCPPPPKMLDFNSQVIKFAPKLKRETYKYTVRCLKPLLSSQETFAQLSLNTAEKLRVAC